MKHKPIRTMDASSAASDPGGIEVSKRRLRSFCPELYGIAGLREQNRRRRLAITEHLLYGDSRAAVVISEEPFLVAAYSDELDCVALLEFPATLRQDLHVASRLLTVNTYRRGSAYAADLFAGPHRGEAYVNFHPIIADFVCADRSRVEARKEKISEDEWGRTLRLGNEYVAAKPGLHREGAPCRSGVAATPEG
jgi:hypothetical protein